MPPIRRTMKSLVMLALMLPAASGLNCSGCSEELPSPRELANTLSDEFTEMLEFEDGVVVEGLPPESDPDGPRLDAFTAPLLAGAEESLDGTVVGYDYEQWFPVLFRSSDDPANLEHVVGCYAYVQQANTDDQAERHLKVEPRPELYHQQDGAERIFFFEARVHRLAELHDQLTRALRSRLLPRDVPADMAAADGNAYHIYIALFSRTPDGTEKVGNYLIWNLSTYPHQAGDNPVEMCPAHSAFSANALSDTNLRVLGESDAQLTEAFGQRPSASSPCDAWNRYASGHNTIMDTIFQLAPDPDYQESATVLYPAGTRFFLHGEITSPPLETAPQRQLELAWCPGDRSRCQSDADCPTTRHRCCDGLCRDTFISDNFCGDCDLTCTGDDQCVDELCGQQTCAAATDCPVPGELCCANLCIDPLNQAAHCGACGNPCSDLEQCHNGLCVAPPECLVDSDCPGSAGICCGEICYDSLSDPDHCGVCNNPCTADQICSGGTCTQAAQCLVDTDCAPPNDICCDNLCANSQIDPQHCGDCLTVCAPTEECRDGTCVPIPECTIDSDCLPPNDICCDNICTNSLLDPDHCGDCLTACTADEECADGFCVPLPQCTQDADCPLNSGICCGNLCYDSLTDNQHCGMCNHPCIDPETCQDGQCCPVGGCLNEVVLAKWAFDPDALGNPSLVPSEVAAHVIAEDFTSADGVPNRLVSPGPIHWVGEDDWTNQATALMAMLSTEAGWGMEITRVEFDHTLMTMTLGMPDMWELSTMGGPGPLASGPIQSEVPDFLHEDVPIPPDTYDPQFVEFLWHARNCQEPGITWGLDNVTIYGFVQPY